ncbi:tRNA nucleotidyltransferase (CCA-adding enzyme) [Litorivivens lipolytica]|uniref:tRNA nucleotidyltransferase (CCA-adding enzyme) n=1 Tax=Litorivivens lipolytica TaxID=1524264 RepID=A0A7W4W615_9GAMM|nr:hypothetical protein [Litorivivens lipolytica]MBB3048126.1 tRNA nucleotidyltransferase (CCA-adding enzyme) [Litorivivens lipolytica]
MKLADGAQCYKVGGAVRDYLLKRDVKEVDWVVVGSTPQAMLAAGFTQVGKDFPVFLHPSTHEEYALARTERKRGRGYHGFEIDAHPDVTLEEDLQRRDLTVNAMAMTDEGDIIDPYRGQHDLEARLLRHVSPAFAEDPLRVLRTARFAARYHYLGFTIAEETLALMRQLSRSGELATLAKERVWQEIQKGLGEQSPQVMLSTLQDCEALPTLFPEWADSIEPSLLDLLSHSTALSVDCRFALSTSGLSHKVVKCLCTELTVPKVPGHLAQLYATVLPLPHVDDCSPEAAQALLEKADVLRRPELIEQLCAVEALRTGQDYKHLLSAAAAMQAVTSDALIAEGFSGKALGQALREQRLHAIKNALTKG